MPWDALLWQDGSPGMDGRIIPFDTYNLFYRDNLESSVLKRLREEREFARV